MGLLNGMESTLNEGSKISEDIEVKNLLFGYIYCHFPVTYMLCCSCPGGWTQNSCHIEFDAPTFSKLVEMGALKPVDHNVVYEACQARIPSHFDPAIHVPLVYCKCSEWILNEYDAWHKGCIDRGDSDAIENMKNRLKQHMIDYYNKNYECYGIA